ncbi:MAG: HepT-like ribonuclease domain-containing protein [Chloroflexota bacterium]
MLDAAQAGIRFARSHRRENLDSDEMLLFAVVRAVEIVGEAAARCSDDSRSSLPDIPWQDIVGMRNSPLHG